MTYRLRLPIGVENDAPTLPDDVVVPEPRVWTDGFAGNTENLQGLPAAAGNEHAHENEESRCERVVQNQRLGSFYKKRRMAVGGVAAVPTQHRFRKKKMWECHKWR